MAHKKGKYFPGDHAAYCDVCGFRYLRSEMRIRWDGLMVCEPDWETKHDLDMPNRFYPVTQPVQFARPDSTRVERTVNVILIADETGAGSIVGIP